MADKLQVLADNRDALLLAEAGAWLHMLGKRPDRFSKPVRSDRRQI
jgi:hypothetical protein